MCSEAESFIDDVLSTGYAEFKTANKSLSVKKYNLLKDDNLNLVGKYFKAYHVPKDEQVYPIVFIGNRYLAGEKAIIENFITEILHSKPEEAAAPGITGMDGRNENTVLSRFKEFGIAGVLVTGLINGLNPCSMSMLLFFLSLLITKNVNVVKIGIAFCLGKLIAYFLLGTIFFKLLESINTGWISTVIKIIMIGMVAFLMMMNIRDYCAVKNENYGNVKVQLPIRLRKFNHNMIRKISDCGRLTLLLPLGFLLGIVISVGEFLCTGQIYLATIIYVMNSGSSLSSWALVQFLAYNLALILPLLAIICFVHKGREIFNVSEVVRKFLPAIKLMNAFIFLLLGAMILLVF